MSNIIIIAILLVIVGFALKESFQHFKGEGGCCGGNTQKEKKKELQGKLKMQKIVHIEGMHCQNCKNSVEKSINRIEGAAVQVNLKKKIAVVSMNRLIEDKELEIAVSKAGFEVISIETKE